MNEMNDTDHRNAMKNVPKWAQRHIEDQNQRIAELTRRVTELSEGPADSNVRARHHVHPDVQLGNGVPVAFAIGDQTPGNRTDITVQHSRDDPGVLEIRVVSDRSGLTLYTSPVVSNHIRLSTGKI